MQADNLKRCFWVFFLSSLLVLAALGEIDLGLRNAVTPSGIISFELCAYTSTCNAALESWGTKGQALAMLSLGLDYLYMVLYPGFICAGLLLVARRVPDALKGMTAVAAWVALGAGVADAAENFSLIQIILYQSGERYGFPAAVFATIKFAIFGSTLSWLLFTSVTYALFRRRTA